MAPSATVELISNHEIVETLTDIAERHFQTTLEGLLQLEEAGKLDACDDAEILTLIRILRVNEQGRVA